MHVDPQAAIRAATLPKTFPMKWFLDFSVSSKPTKLINDILF